MSILNCYRPESMTEFERCQCALLDRIGDALEQNTTPNPRPCEWRARESAESGRPVMHTGRFHRCLDNGCLLVEEGNGDCNLIAVGDGFRFTDREAPDAS